MENRLTRKMWSGISVAIVLALVFAPLAMASVWTDKWDYDFGETVQINGNDMDPGEKVLVEVYYPNGSLAQSREISADDQGEFSDTFFLSDDMPGGIYKVVAYGLFSGNEYTTEFDPCIITLSNATGQYSDVIQFSGEVGVQGAGCSNGVNSRNVAIDIDLNGDGDFNDLGEEGVAFGLTAVTGSGSFGINWKVPLKPGGGAELFGSYRIQARLITAGNSPHDTAKSSPHSLLTINKEFINTAYGGDANGAPGATVNVSATIMDNDESYFADDPNLSGMVTFELKNGAIVLATISASLNSLLIPLQGGIAAETLVIPSGTPPGEYTMVTTYSGNDYYLSSYDTDTFEVTASDVWTITGFYSPVERGIHNIVKGGATVPLKFNVYKNGVEQDNTGVIETFTQKIKCADGPGDNIDLYTTGSTSLRYDGGQFIFNWKTLKEPGACYRVTVAAGNDEIFADFTLK
jgi:hypothetical protein